MTRFADLSDDVLLSLPLSREDILSMVKVSSRIRRLFVPLLYKSIEFLGCEGVALRRFHSLLNANPQLCNYIRRLKFLDDTAGFPDSSIEPMMSCIIGLTAQKLTHLTLDTLNPLSYCGYNFSQLIEVKVYGLDRWESRDAPTRLAGYQRIRRVEFHSSDHFHLGSMHGVRIALPVDVVSHPAYRTSTGREIVLNGLHPGINREAIRQFFQFSRDLTSLVFVGGHADSCRSEDHRLNGAAAGEYESIMEDDSDVEKRSTIKDSLLTSILEAKSDVERRSLVNDYRDSCCYMESDIATLDAIFRLTSGSLEKLTIIRDCEERCHGTRAMLRPLTALVKLRALRIDDCFLLGGDRLCPAHSSGRTDGVINRNPRDFAKLLPPNLERLDLHVSQFELEVNSDYCMLLLEGLVKDRDRLKVLRHVSIDEMPEQFMDETRQQCRRCGSTSELSFLKETTITDSQIRHLQEDFASIGIQMTYTKRGMKQLDFQHDRCMRLPQFTAKIYVYGSPPTIVPFPFTKCQTWQLRHRRYPYYDLSKRKLTGD